MGTAAPPPSRAMDARDLAPYLATGRIPHHPRWPSSVAPPPAPPPAEARPKVPRADKRHQRDGRGDLPLAQRPVEPGLGLIQPSGAFANARCGACGPPLANGGWGVWPSTGRVCTPCPWEQGASCGSEGRSQASALGLRDQTGRNASCTRTRAETRRWCFWGQWSTTDEAESRVVRHRLFSPTGC